MEHCQQQKCHKHKNNHIYTLLYTHSSIHEHNVITDSINGVQIGVFNDTIKALSVVRISGHIENQNGQKLTDFFILKA